jgi:glucarate dehydratase
MGGTLKIADIRATTVTVPLEAPLQHASGAHWGRFVRTIVEVETDDGLVGLGEMGGGGESAESAFEGLKSYLVGHDPFELEALRFKIMNPTASLYNNRAQLHAAIEFGCLDLMGQKLELPVHTLLGGKLRDRVPFASYLFFRYANAETGEPEIWWSMHGHSRKSTVSLRISSRVASIRRNTNWSATGLSPARSPKIP